MDTGILMVKNGKFNPLAHNILKFMFQLVVCFNAISVSVALHKMGNK